jgi:hypothetical protein
LTPGEGDTSTTASPSFTPTSTGYWCFTGYYSGDSNYAVSSDTTTTEGCFDVTGPPPSVNVAPPSGPPGTPVTVSGEGFAPGETVKILYKTGLPSPRSVTVCTATALPDTSYGCSGVIPTTATAGANGAHKIVAKGLTSLIKVKTTFTLT